MKRFVIIGICLLLGSTVVQAGKTRYVTDVNKITMRTGQGLDHKILAIVKSGEKVEIIKQDEAWTMIRRSDGKEGWVLSRFLSSKKPNRLILENLKIKYETLSVQSASFQKENTELKEKNKQLSADLGIKAKELQKNIESYETLKKESADFLKLKSNYKKSTKTQAEMAEKTNKMEEELNYLQTQHIFKWFLVGAGVLLVGFIVGFSARRPRRRPSLL